MVDVQVSLDDNNIIIIAGNKYQKAQTFSLINKFFLWIILDRGGKGGEGDGT